MSTTTRNNPQNIIDQKRLLSAQLFHVNRLRIQFPERVHTHDVVYRHQTVTVLPLTNDNELYMVRQYRYLHKKMSLEAMAGFVEKGEEPLDAARRELKEETGIKAKKWSKLTTFELAASVIKGTNHIYLAQDLTLGKANQNEDEDIELAKMPLTKALEQVLDNSVNHAASMIGILMTVQKIQGNSI